MGFLLMSRRDLERIEIFNEVLARKRSHDSALYALGLTYQHYRKLFNAFRTGGGAALIHKARGRSSNNSKLTGLREYVIGLIKTHYVGFGPTLISEMLLSRDSVSVSRETLRKWMLEEGLWVSRKQRRGFHQPRHRRESFGELIQIDGSEHRWFEDRAGSCTLIVFIDDATGRLVHLSFHQSESTDAYMTAVHTYLREYGCPVAFYSDKASIFRVNRASAARGSGVTQFGRALSELHIQIICANTSQAKGRVERANRTLQDRLVKELRLAGISDMGAANAFVPGFLKVFNDRFAIEPICSENAHRELRINEAKLTDILCQRESRYVTRELVVTYQRKQLILDRTPTSERLGQKYVDVLHFPDGRIDIRSQDISLPFTVFNKDRRVNEGAIVENKRLSHALALIKAKQDQFPEVKLMTNSEKGGYVKRPRRVYGPDYIPKKPASAATPQLDTMEQTSFAEARKRS